MTLISPENSFESIFNKMAQSQANYYLTGSRFFGTYTVNSDWDFYVADCPEVRKELENLGFTEEKNSYSDGLTSKVYVHQSANVHVQCVKDIHVKEHVQNSLLVTSKKHPSFFKNISKKREYELWQTMIEFAYYMRGSI